VENRFVAISAQCVRIGCISSLAPVLAAEYK